MCQICQALPVTKNKVIDTSIYDAFIGSVTRSLQQNFKTLLPTLKKGMRVLEIGCGNGSLAKDIAYRVGPEGHVVGIDNNALRIAQGKEAFKDIANLELIHGDFLTYDNVEKFDIIISACTFQWISTLDKAIDKVKALLKPQGQISILDYNHEGISWTPKVPASMQHYYNMFLMWRKDGGMNNRIGFDLVEIFEEHGFSDIHVRNADEQYESTNAEHLKPIKLWSAVAASNQLVKEGYVSESERQQAIEDYNHWVDTNAIRMTVKLREVTAVLN